MRVSIKSLCFTLAIAVLSFAFSCKKETALGGDIAYVAVYNAIPAATALNFLIDNKVVNGTSPLVFGGNTAYTGVYQGNYSTQTVITNSSTPLPAVPVSFEGKVSR
ncbi:MAG: hypothetical protein EOO20_29155, partial [Chryseobacterium sp.]